jgi:hypothetical protein
LLKLAGVTAQFSERLRVIGRDNRGHTMIARDIKAHIDAAKLRRIETQLKARIAAIEAADNFACNLRRGGRAARSGLVCRGCMLGLRGVIDRSGACC